jgi:hypothetical protein
MTENSSELSGYSTIPEPDLMFAQGGLDKHPLRGLIDHGPYGLKYGTPANVRFALLAPGTKMRQLRGLVSELSSIAKTREVPAYYPDYPGFEKVFRAPIAPIDDQLVFAFPDELDVHAQRQDKRALASGLLQCIAQLRPNRQSYVRDPSTGNRLSRPNPKSEWIVEAVPELRIVSQTLWDSCTEKSRTPQPHKRSRKANSG